MKYVEFNLDSNKIEFFNSIIGKETVFLNGEKISSKFSIMGTKHTFKINSKDHILKSKYTLKDPFKINLQLSKNDILIEEISTMYNTKHAIYTSIIGVFIGVIGYNIGKYLIHIIS